MGMINCGVGLAKEAWASVRMAWEVEPKLPTISKMLPKCPIPPLSYGNLNRVPSSFLDKHPVDVILVDDSWGNRDSKD